MGILTDEQLGESTAEPDDPDYHGYEGKVNMENIEPFIVDDKTVYNKELDNYPHDELPLLKGYNVQSIGNTVSGGKAIMRISGFVEVPMSEVGKYYRESLKDSPNFWEEEGEQPTSGNSFTALGGTKGKWRIKVLIVESSHNSKRTLEVQVERSGR